MNLLQRWFVRRLLSRAERHQISGHPEEAVPLFETALDYLRERERVNALSRLGLCLLLSGRLAEARKRFEEALSLAPEEATSWLNCGRVCHQLGDLLRADECYQKANELAPERPDIHYHLATYYAEKYTRAAMEAAKRAIRVTLEFLEKPGGPAALQALGFPAELPLVLLRNLGLERGDPQDAAAHLREIAGRPTTPATAWLPVAALNHLGLLLTNTGKYAEAEAVFRELLAIDSSVDPAHFNLALTLARLHRTDEAEKELRIYAERHKGSPVVSFGYGSIAEHDGNAESARRHYEAMLQRYERTPVSPALLARLDVPRKWLEYGRRFIQTLDGSPPPAPGPGEQWIGPGGASA